MIFKRRHSEEGQSMVEFALIAPLLFLVLFAIIQFGLMFYTYIDLTSSVREGARKATVSRTNANPIQATKDAISSSTSVVDDSKTTTTVSPAPPWNSGDTVTITTTYPYTLSVMGVTMWGGPMKHTATVRVE